MKTAIIIDFDNTIGYFKQIVYLLNIIEKTQKKQFEQNDVNNLIKKYPKSLRPKIDELLFLIDQMKKKNNINFFILYTTNKNKKFVNMVANYIEKMVCSTKEPLFDFKFFSEKKDKHVDIIFHESIIKNNIPITLCFVDNKNLKQKKENCGITSIFIKCDTYKYLYDIRDIIKTFDYTSYDKINKKIISKYFKYIYDTKTFINLPIQLNEINSIHMINLINEFCYSERCL